jgi:3-oxoadipate enol-lactonase
LNQDEFTFAFADVRGYGKSKDQSGEYTAVEVVADIAELGNSLGWSQFNLVGHSMTGMVVQRAMLDIPERLIKVVAATPVPASGLGVDDDTFSFFLSMTTDDEAFKGGMAALTSAQYGDEWGMHKLALNRTTVATEAMQTYATMWGKTDFSNEVKGLTTPILIVFGQHDSELLRIDATGAMFAEWYPNLETHVCLCGHYPMQETPVEYAHVVQQDLLS